MLEFFHFSCTSEDINNLAHALMLKEALDNTILPVVDDLIEAIGKMAKDNAQISMLSRTHGQVQASLFDLDLFSIVLNKTEMKMVMKIFLPSYSDVL